MRTIQLLDSGAWPPLHQWLLEESCWPLVWCLPGQEKMMVSFYSLN